MMKKKEFVAMLMLTLCMGLSAGCSSKTESDTTPPTEQITAAVENHVTEAEETEETEEVCQVEGTVDEIKDFMFVITDSKGTSYSFAFEEKPDGLEKVKVGDNVTVKYTGTLSEIDPFVGEVISVEKK